MPPPARIRWEPRKARSTSRRMLVYLLLPGVLVWVGAIYLLRSSETLPTSEPPPRSSSSHASPPPPTPTRTEASHPPPSPPSPSYILTSFQDGRVLGDGLRFLVSVYGLRWTALPGEPLSLPLERLRAIDQHATVIRDPSVVWHADYYYLVFTSNLCVDQVYGHWQCRRHTKPRPVAKFGFARSRDLHTWEDVRLVEMPIRDACSLWAPEVTALPDGGLLVLFTATLAAGLCPPTMRESEHVPYYTITRDLRKFTPPRRLDVSGGDESIIDMCTPRLCACAPLRCPRALARAPRAPPAPPPSRRRIRGPQQAARALKRGAWARAARVRVRGSHARLSCDPRASDPLLIDRQGASDGTPQHILFYKAEANLCGRPYTAPLEWNFGGPVHRNASCSLVIRMARARSPTGPWHADPHAHGAFFSDAISRPCVEGPTALQEPNGSWLVLFDNYRSDCVLLAPPEGGTCGALAGRPAATVGLRRRYQAERAGRCAYESARQGFGAMRSHDLHSWHDVSGAVSAPPFYKHGSALRPDAAQWRAVCAHAATSGSPFERVCRERGEAVGRAAPAGGTSDDILDGD
jgi:hypothetical protein